MIHNKPFLLVLYSVLVLASVAGTCQVKFELIAPPDITIGCYREVSDLSVTGNAIVLGMDGGGTLTHRDVETSLVGCRGGHVVRRFIAKDSNGNEIFADQRIMVAKEKEADVQAPASYCSPFTSTVEELEPENLPKGYGRPLVYGVNCSAPAMNHTDRVTFTLDGRVRIFRKWEVCRPCSGDCQTFIQVIESPLAVQGRETDDVKTTNKVTRLLQNRPNPFSGNTLIGFELPEASFVTLTVHYHDGRVLQTFEGMFPAGLNEIDFDPKGKAAQGVFFYTLTTPIHRETKRMTLTW